MLRWARDAVAGAWLRMSANVWTVFQTTLAATAAWGIAVHWAGHRLPFFAPISAVVALTAARGERGTNAVRLLFGVVVGIVMGELVAGVLGQSVWTLPVSVFLAMMVAVALRAVRLMMVQAAASAILTVVFAGGVAGTYRLVDALIGAGVALVTVQLVFPPDPVGLLREAVRAALAEMRSGLEVVCRALESGDEEAFRSAAERLRDGGGQLGELASARNFSGRIARRVPVRRGLIDRVSAESAHASLLYPLSAGCQMLARASFSLPQAERDGFAPVVQGLAASLGVLAAGPDGREARQKAAGQASEAVRSLRDRPSGEPHLVTATMAARMVALDILLFTGVARERALASVRGAAEEPAVPLPPAG